MAPPDGALCVGIAHAAAGVFTLGCFIGAAIDLPRQMVRPAGRNLQLALAECRRKLRLARVEYHVRRAEKEGSIKLSWHFGLLIDAEGFTLLVEQWDTAPAGDYHGQGETRVKWSAVDSPQATDRHLFLDVPGWVLPIPATAFPGREEFQRFIETVQDYAGPGAARAGITTQPRQKVAVPPAWGRGPG